MNHLKAYPERARRMYEAKPDPQEIILQEIGIEYFSLKNLED